MPKHENKKRRAMRGDRLREMRERRELSQQDLADRVGVTKQQIYRYETGDNDPTADVLTRLAKELQCTMDYLAGLVDKSDEHMAEEDLTPAERKLLHAYRTGRLQELLYLLGRDEELAEKIQQQTQVPSK